MLLATLQRGAIWNVTTVCASHVVQLTGFDGIGRWIDTIAMADPKGAASDAPGSIYEWFNESQITFVCLLLGQEQSCWLNYFFYYRPQRSCGQGYVFTRVCDSVHRGSASVHAGKPPPRQTPLRSRPPPPREGDTPQESRPPPDMVNERLVRILLECILVYF